MRRVKTIIAALPLICMACPLWAQNHEAVSRFLGNGSAEEMNPYDVERMEDFLTAPLDLNSSSAARLRESGLLTRYQAASLADYRSRHGDVMSLAELAAVDGFNMDFVSALAPFISLDSGRIQSGGGCLRIRNDVSVRTGARSGAAMTYGLKYKLTAGERLSGGLSVSRTSDSKTPAPDACSGNVSLHFRRRSGKIVLGDFNARFGQGLALWNGMSFSGLTSADAFMKRPSGISASSSFTGNYSMRGVAADIGLGHWVLSALTAYKAEKGKAASVLPALNAAWLHRNGQVSMTHYADFSISTSCARIPDMKTSADVAFCLAGTDLFAELAYDWVNSRTAALAGVSAPLNEYLRLSSMLRYYPSTFSSERSAAARSTTKCSNEYAVSAAADVNAGGWVRTDASSGFSSNVRRFSGKVSADCAYFPVSKSDGSPESIQIKAVTEWVWMISPSFSSAVRISERIRTWGEPFRTDVRADFSYFSDRLVINLRLNALSCSGHGLLGYMEGGYRSGNLDVYLRTGAFRVDDWDDRIYVYERDAPGSYNVPAYYGRGVWGALTMNWRICRWCRMYMRAACTSYPFMREKKPGRAELKFQFVFRL